MASDWEEVNLGDLFEQSNQGVNTTTEKVEYSDDGLIVIRAKNISAYSIDYQDVVHVSEETFDKLKSAVKPKCGDILFTNIGSQLGSAALVKNNSNFIIAWNVFRIVPNLCKVNAKFLESFLNSEETGNLVRGLNASSTMPFISGKVLRGIKLNLPPLPEQKAIAHILGSLDDKIELNRQMNETLEAMAQALFKSWFVDFDPVIDNALAVGNAIPDEFMERAEQRKGVEKKDNSDIQSLFPDEFEFTEEMGWIPKGWEVRKLKSICRVLNGRAYKNTEFKEQGTPIVRIQNLSRSGKTVYSDLDLPDDKIICTEDFLYAWSATFGPHIWRGPKSIYHYHIWKMDVDENIVSRYFLYLAMFRKTESMKNAGTGSIFTHLTKKIMEGQDILIGDEKVNTAFSNQVTVIFKKITKLDEENSSLSKIRDTLLPKLISSELRIPDAILEKV